MVVLGELGLENEDLVVQHLVRVRVRVRIRVRIRARGRAGVRVRVRVRVGVGVVVGHLLLVDVLDEHVEGLRVAVHLGRD